MLVRLYSKSTGCTYLPGVHETIPSDSVEISEEVYNEVIANPAPGKIRSHDPDGRPLLIDVPEPSLSTDELASIERGWRDSIIATTEWLVTRHRDEVDMQLPTTLPAGNFAQLLAYRRSLRDWPQSELFPSTGHRPAAPPWLPEQVQ